MAEDKEPILSRWSRLKTERREAPKRTGSAGEARVTDRSPGPDPESAQRAGASQALAPAALPPVDTLTPESDFAPFMQRGVADALRRAALKKLFSDPHFNVPDPNEAYSGDWTDGGALGSEILAKLDRAREQLAGTNESEPATSPGEARAGGEDAPDARGQTVEGAATAQTDEGRGQDGVARQNA